MKNYMIILCGGRGKRMGKITNNIPKPLIKIRNKPIIDHKIRYYKSQGLNNFIFCLGYKSKKLKSFLIKKKSHECIQRCRNKCWYFKKNLFCQKSY